MKCFEKMIWKCFENVKFIYEKFWKKSEVENMKNSPFERRFEKCSERRFRLD
jgi:hypothetical protein